MRRRDQLIDLVICAILLVIAVPVTLQPEPPEGAGAGTSWDTVLLPLVVLPILLRARAPLLAAAALTVGCVLSGIPTFDQFRLGAAIPAAMLVAFSVARHRELPAALAGLAALLGGLAFVGATDAVLTGAEGIGAMMLFSFPLCAGIWGAGRVARSRDAVAVALSERSRSLALQREQTAALAVEVERARLASDVDAAARVRLRDIVAAAEGGEAALGQDPEAVRDAFGSIESLGRESLNEMRGLLGVLRSDERGPRSPRPTLAELDALLAGARAGGRLVDLEVEGEPVALAGSAEVAAYRTLQHALVAVHGHEGEPARVVLRYLPQALEVEVHGAAVDGSAAAAALAAARERVTAHGGSFRARTAGRRRLLQVWLPAEVLDG